MEKKHYYGHYQRLRRRFLQQGLDGFQDYEALELLLTFVSRRQDMKPLAKGLIKRFGSFKDVLDAAPEELQVVEGVGPVGVTLIRFVKQAAARYLQQTSRARFSPDSPEVLVQYCIVSMGAEPNEKFRMICLDSRFAIVGEANVAPRARGYFDNAEVQYIIACFAVLLGWYGDQRGDIRGYALQELSSYVDECLKSLAQAGVVHEHPLARYLQQCVGEIEALTEGQTLNVRLADYLYQMIAHPPFADMMEDENRVRNLAIFSQLLNIFQSYYHYAVITHANREIFRYHFFNSYLRFLYIGGINEYEDPDRPFPKGHVQVMTVHQAKGLEFPVVIIGSLATNIGSPKQVNRLLGDFYHRAPFEPEDRITEFDRMRLHYVAFSRAEKLLVLTSTEEPKRHFWTIWQGLPQWPYVRQDLLKALHFRLRNRMALKKSFSFTSDVKVYETCPRQYQFFREYEFTPSRSAEIFFGSLVHQTIEDIHRWVLDGQAIRLIQAAIPSLFEANFRGLVNAGYRPIDEAQRAIAYQQVVNYFKQNQDRMSRILEIEVDVSVEKEDYILSGKIDLLLGEDDRLELLDFKSQPRPEVDDVRLEGYYRQLLVYAHILEQRYNRHPERLYLYWTGEERRDDALMCFPYEPGRVAEAGAHFDRVVARILAEDFAVRQVPETRVCSECDFRAFCAGKETISVPSTLC